MARTKTKAAEDTSFDPSEFDPAMQPEAVAVIKDVAAATEMPPEPPATGYLANPSSIRREPNTADGYAATFKKREFKPLADPFGENIVMLSTDPNGPRASILRSKEHNDMWIQFTENPGEGITGKLKEAGFHRERQAVSDFAKGAWVLPLEPGREWSNHAHAEEVFKNVVNQIRAANGMEPFVSGAAQSAG